MMPGIPESLPRAEVYAWIESLGFELKHLRSLVVHSHSIEAVVLALDADGKPYATDGYVAEHYVQIPLTA